MREHFSFFRLWGLIIKEFTQFKRDRSTFAIIIVVPIFQLLLFGLAINTNPKHLPSALLNFDNGPFSRSLIQQLENTQYFHFDHTPPSENAAKELMETHQTLFTLYIPPDFSRKLVRGERPAALLEVDGTDPVSVAYALSAAAGLLANGPVPSAAPTSYSGASPLMAGLFEYDLVGPLQVLNPRKGPAELRVHTNYNPNAITQYNIVPGLLGTVLTLTFVMVASMALTRERERGTMETLLATPILPLEVIVGKAAPFIIVGYLQVLIVISLAAFFFHVPVIGNPVLLFLFVLPFILANLSVGITISTLAKTQLEASQISIFFFLPSMLLSGFAFPFKGMPNWAQAIGNVLPLTHFINIVRGIMLKGISLAEVWVDLWPICVFMLIMLVIALKRYRQTLD
jgi:ABC-2 type transport system permease protein